MSTQVSANLSARARHEMLARLGAEPLDMLIIGGGITGAGIALDAATRGYHVGLVERSDFASGTSSWSTKLVHGGIRYLPELDIGLVREALLERGRLLRNAPYLVHPLAFVLPLYASSRHPVGLPVAPPGGIGLSAILNLGLFTYDVLAGRENVAPHRHISREDVLQRAPDLIPDGLKTGFLYYDAQTNDTRLTMAVLRSAVERGALVANYTECVRVERANGRVAGAWVRETLPGASGNERLIRARYVVNATGVWAEQTERLAGISPDIHIAPSKGVHLVFSREKLLLGDEAVVLPETADGRIIFIVPWLSRAIVGTTDTEVKEIEHPTATEDDITYLLEHLNRYVRNPVTRDDILSTYAGNRPLLRLRSQASAAKLSRSHEVVESEDGLLTISGGKLTTYRKMAEDLVDRIGEHERRKEESPTRRLKLIGASRLPEVRAQAIQEGKTLGLDTDVILHLVDAYGSEALDVLALVEGDAALGQRLLPDLPYLRAEVVRVCRAEMAITVEDVLARRLRISLLDGTRGLAALEDVAGLMARELGWSEDERQRQIAAYNQYVRLQAGPLIDVLEARLSSNLSDATASLAMS